MCCHKIWNISNDLSDCLLHVCQTRRSLPSILFKCIYIPKKKQYRFNHSEHIRGNLSSFRVFEKISKISLSLIPNIFPPHFSQKIAFLDRGLSRQKTVITDNNLKFSNAWQERGKDKQEEEKFAAMTHALSEADKDPQTIRKQIRNRSPLVESTPSLCRWQNSAARETGGGNNIARRLRPVTLAKRSVHGTTNEPDVRSPTAGRSQVYIYTIYIYTHRCSEGVLPDRGGGRRARTKLRFKPFAATRRYTGRGVSRLILAGAAAVFSARRSVSARRHRMSPPSVPARRWLTSPPRAPTSRRAPFRIRYLLYGVSIRFPRRRTPKYSFLSKERLRIGSFI